MDKLVQSRPTLDKYDSRVSDNLGRHFKQFWRAQPQSSVKALVGVSGARPNSMIVRFV